MRVKIQKGTAKGYIDAPPSKSMAHRMLICAGLSKGTSVIRGVSYSEDVLATIDCLEVLGAKCVRYENSIEVTGIDVEMFDVDEPMPCRESGSTLRFLIPLCLTAGKEISLTGSTRLFERPLDVYEEVCKEKQVYFAKNEEEVTVKGPIKAGTYKVAGNISSQFISGLLFALPLLDGESKIEITTSIESRPYIDMTLDAMTLFGVNGYWEDDRTIIVPGNQIYVARDVLVEGDFSNAAFMEALNAIGGEVEVGNLNQNSLQGDKVYDKLLAKLEGKNAKLDLRDCPDLGPIFFAVAAAKNGGHFVGTERLKIKESDRALAMAKELGKFGVDVKVADDHVIIEAGELKEPAESLSGHNDHRIVMALAVLSTITGGIIEGAEAVKKSYPNFFEEMANLGIKMDIREE